MEETLLALFSQKKMVKDSSPQSLTFVSKSGVRSVLRGRFSGEVQTSNRSLKVVETDVINIDARPRAVGLKRVGTTLKGLMQKICSVYCSEVGAIMFFVHILWMYGALWATMSFAHDAETTGFLRIIQSVGVFWLVLLIPDIILVPIIAVFYLCSGSTDDEEEN